MATELKSKNNLNLPKTVQWESLCLWELKALQEKLAPSVWIAGRSHGIQFPREIILSGLGFQAKLGNKF